MCKGKIIEGKTAFGCANWRPEAGNCRFVIWKEISGKKLTFANVQTLADGKITRPYVFKGAGAGEKFKAKLRMIQTRDGGWTIEIQPQDGSENRWVSCTRS